MEQRRDVRRAECSGRSNKAGGKVGKKGARAPKSGPRTGLGKGRRQSDAAIRIDSVQEGIEGARVAAAQHGS